jgi:hypothetical protein
MKWLVGISYLIGFEYYSSNQECSRKFSQKFIFIIHLIYIFLNLKFQYDFHSILLLHPDVLGNCTNLIEMIAPILCHFMIVLESVIKTSKGNRIRRIQNKICSDLKMDKKFNLINFFWLFLVNSFIFLIIFMLLSNIKGKFSQNFFIILLKFDTSLGSLVTSYTSDITINLFHKLL